MIDLKIYIDKLDSALSQKSNEKYKKFIKNELSKTDWHDRKFKLDKLLSSIKTTDDFEKYQKDLIKLFDDLYEVITAPGVDDFINWMNDITDNKNESKTKELQKFLVDKFSESSISEGIETVLNYKNSLNIENSIFDKLISEIRKQIKKDCNEFLNKQNEYENNIDSFLEKIGNTLSEITTIPELEHTNKNQQYTNDQIESNIEFYTDILDAILDLNQSIKPINDSDKNIDLVQKIKNRIYDIKECINTLHTSVIANNTDNNLQNLFLKFKDEMVKYEGGVNSNLIDFIENKWNEIEQNYNVINEFITNKIDIIQKPNWDIYPNKEKIVSLIIDYNSLIKDNPILLINSQKNFEIQKSFAGKTKNINQFNNSIKILKDEIIELFEKTVSEFEDKKLPLLESLSIINPNLNSIIIEIKRVIKDLKSGVEALKKTENILMYINETFSFDLNPFKDITVNFEKALKESGMSDHLEWLDKKLKESDSGILINEDLEDHKFLKELLEKGLIKLNIEKQF